MAAVIRRPVFGAGSIRLGPECFKWYDPFTRSLSFEVERVNVAVIGGLNWTLEPWEYRWIEAAMIDEGLRMAQYRVLKGPDGKPLLDDKGEAIVRRRLLPMPSLRRHQNLKIPQES